MNEQSLPIDKAVETYNWDSWDGPEDKVILRWPNNTGQVLYNAYLQNPKELQKVLEKWMVAWVNHSRSKNEKKLANLVRNAAQSLTGLLDKMERDNP